MKKIMIAGCSFSSSSRDHPGTSWSEVLAQQLDWQCVNLARQGCSNGAIRLQIDAIIQARPDFAIITPTFWDRIEIPVVSQCWSDREDQTPDYRHNPNSVGYDRDAGLDNINYGTNTSRMISETIFSLITNSKHGYRSEPLDRETNQALRHYVTYLYDSKWKKQQDEWIITEGVLRLFYSGIPFIVSPVLLWPWQDSDPNLWRHAFPAVVPDHYIMLSKSESVLSVSALHPWLGVDPGYHMSAQGQQVIAANYLRRMREDHGI